MRIKDKHNNRLTLKDKLDSTISITGEIDRLGVKPTGKSPKKHALSLTPTICIKNIRDMSGNLVIDHAWLTYSRVFGKLGELKKGDHIAFDAKVKQYRKGHFKGEVDYTITSPKHVKLLTKHRFIPVPLMKKELIGYVIIKIHRNDDQPISGTYTNAYKQWVQKQYKKMVNSYPDEGLVG